MLDLIADFEGLRCKEARDKIYGFRDLASDGADITVDYSKPLVYVMFDALSVPNRKYTHGAYSAGAYPGVFKDVERLLECIPLGKDDILPFLGSDDAGLPSLLEADDDGNKNLCHWLHGSPEYELKNPDHQGFTESSIFGREYHCPSSMRQYDFVFPLVQAGAPQVKAAVYRVNAERQIEFVDLVSTTLEHTLDSWLREVRQALRTLWHKGHICVCSVPGLMRPYNLYVGFMKVHFSMIAVLAHAAISMLGAETLSTFIKAINESLVARPRIPCGCIETSKLPAVQIPFPDADPFPEVQAASAYIQDEVGSQPYCRTRNRSPRASSMEAEAPYWS